MNLADEPLTAGNWKVLSHQAIEELPPDLRAAVSTHQETEEFLIFNVKGEQQNYLLGIGRGHIPESHEDPGQPSVFIDVAGGYSKLALLDQTDASAFKRLVKQGALYQLYLLGMVSDRDGQYVRTDGTPILPAVSN